jgi:hypothetical protein
MNTEIEHATINYKEVCNKNGFCVVKIIPQNMTLNLVQPAQIQQTPAPIAQKTVKLSSSRKNKKR